MYRMPRFVGSHAVVCRSFAGGPFSNSTPFSVIPSVMLKLLPLFVFSSLLMATTLPAAPSYVTGGSKGCRSTSSCSVSLTGTNAGDLIVLGLFVSDSTSVSSVTDTQGNTFALIGSPQTWSPYNFVERLYYAKNIKGGADTITVNLNAIPSYSLELHTYDYSGLDTSSPLDVTATPKTGTGTSGTSNSLTTTNANDLLFAFFHSDNGVTTAGSGFTGRTPPADSTPLGEDKNVTSTGSYSATMSFSASADYVGFLVAFKAASGGVGGLPTYVTGGSKGCRSTSSCSVSLTGTNAGDLIVLGLFVSDSTSVSSVTDTQGNTFALIASPQTWSPYNFVERLYYAKNIKGGADTITVNLNAIPSYSLELHTYDYSGLDTSSPLDVTATPKTGTGTSGTSNSLTTTNANDLLFAFFHSDNGVTTAGSGFTGRTPPADSTPLGEDKNVISTGSYSATMSFSASADYVGFLVAFKAASGGVGGASPSITTQPSNQTVTAGQTATFTVAATGTSPLTYQWSQNMTAIGGATSSSYTTPAETTANNGAKFTVVVTNSAGSATSNAAILTVNAAAAGPSISMLSPTSGPIGTLVTITGMNFGAAQGTVNFNGTAAAVTSWSASSITATVPSGASSGNVAVTVSGVASNGVNFTVLPSQLPTEAQVVAAIENVNNYWIPNNNTILIAGETPGNADWDQATYFTGDLAAYDATGQANYLTFAQTWATNNSYSLCSAACGEGPGGNTATQPDYQAAGQPYIRLYQLSNNSSDLTGITDSISGMVSSTVDNEWTWIDAVNMSMPDFAELGSIYNNTNYYTKMYALYSYAKYSVPLYDSTTGLWWEDGTYTNSSVHWSRGNGWIFAAHAKVLSVLPNSDPHYAEYLSTFTTMAQALAARQQPGGYWNSDLTGTDYAGPESSGTSFFLYGLAWGLNNGVLDENTYLPVVEKAWNFLANTAIQPSGLLGYVQGTAVAPGPTTATTTYDFGVGAFLLAARQMQLLVK